MTLSGQSRMLSHLSKAVETVIFVGVCSKEKDMMSVHFTLTCTTCSFTYDLIGEVLTSQSLSDQPTEPSMLSLYMLVGSDLPYLPKIAVGVNPDT